MTEYLLGIGAAKAGTTLLYHLLSAHPALTLSANKELHYFDCHEQVSRDAYDALFERPSGIKLDITPAYLFWDGCLPRIHDTLGHDNVKIVVLLRDPIERAVSHYFMTRRHGLEPLSFSESFFREKERMAASAMGYRQHSYFSRGKYAQQLDVLYSLYPREQVKILLFEDIVGHQQETVDEVTDFCGIERMNITPSAANKGCDVKSTFVAHALRALSRRLPKPLLPLYQPVRRVVSYCNQSVPDPAQVLPDALRRQLAAYYTEDIRRLSTQYGVNVQRFKNFRESAFDSVTDCIDLGYTPDLVGRF